MRRHIKSAWKHAKDARQVLLKFSTTPSPCFNTTFGCGKKLNSLRINLILYFHLMQISCCEEWDGNRDGNFLKIHFNEICVNQIHIKSRIGLDLLQLNIVQNSNVFSKPF